MDETFNPTKETISLLIYARQSKAQLPWPDLTLKSSLAGVLLFLGALFNIRIAGGAG